MHTLSLILCASVSVHAYLLRLYFFFSYAYTYFSLLPALGAFPRAPCDRKHRHVADGRIWTGDGGQHCVAILAASQEPPFVVGCRYGMFVCTRTRARKLTHTYTRTHTASTPQTHTQQAPKHARTRTHAQHSCSSIHECTIHPQIRV